MIHEAMALDHGGPDLALILYGSALKLFLMACLLTRLLIPTASGAAGWAAWGAGLLAIALTIGVVESAMARLRLSRVPQFLVAAICAGAFALILALR